MAMGIFSRLGQLIKSNINDLISRSEDPEKMLNQVIIDMNNQLVEARKQVAVAIADEKRLRKQWEAELNLARDWKKKAMMAVRAGDDGLAKEALQRKKEHEDLSEQYQKQWESQKTGVEQLKGALRLLNNKIEEAKRKKNLLIAKKKRAEAQKMIQETMTGLQEASAFETFERMEKRIEQMEAEAEAAAELAGQMTGDTLTQKFQQLEASTGVDMDLLELKEEMGLLPAAAEQDAVAELAAAADASEPSAADAAAEISDEEAELVEVGLGPQEAARKARR
jgi:phage shock protein A